MAGVFSKITYTVLFLSLWNTNEYGLFSFALVKDTTPSELVTKEDIDPNRIERPASFSHNLIRKEASFKDELLLKADEKQNALVDGGIQNLQEKFDLPLLPSQTLYGTLPYLDERNSQIQSIPGAINFALYDVGGEGKAYHSSSEENFGSCELNPCDLVEIRNILENDPHDVNGDGVAFDEEDIFHLYYLNSLRREESASVSYTKWAVGDWAGDRHASDGTQMTPYIPYWGWLPMGEWVRLTFDVKTAGLYTADLTATCNSGGYISVRIDKAIQLGNELGRTEDNEDESESEMFINEIIGSTVDEAPVFTESHIRVPSSGHYHQWQLYEAILKDVEFPSIGLHVLTVTIESFDSYPNGQFGNMMQLHFSPQN